MTSQFTRRPRGFTLVEILVVIGIIVILAGLLVPMVGRAMRQAKRTRMAADMQSIATALEAFKADHGDYPRVANVNTGAATLGRFLFGPYGNGTKDTDGNPLTAEVFDNQDPPAYSGATAYLPGDAVRDPGGAVTDPTYVAIQPTTGNPPSPTSLFWGVIQADDGADGAGLTMRGGGKKWGPYLQADKFKFRGLAVLDGNDNPILYFPASPGKPNVTLQGGYLPAIQTPTPANDDIAKYDTSDNWVPFQRPSDADAAPAQQRIHAMLGDIIMNPATQVGAIDSASGEPAAQTAPYLLWSAGPDGLYGPTDITAGAAPADIALNRKSVDQCDDVTNFRQ